jgi:hypothetical protein
MLRGHCLVLKMLSSSVLSGNLYLLLLHCKCFIFTSFSPSMFRGLLNVLMRASEIFGLVCYKDPWLFCLLEMWSWSSWFSLYIICHYNLFLSTSYVLVILFCVVWGCSKYLWWLTLRTADLKQFRGVLWWSRLS